MCLRSWNLTSSRPSFLTIFLNPRVTVVGNKEKNWWKDHKADPAGRMGRFEGRGNYDFDAGIYVELDEDWEVWGIWECEKSVLKELEKGNSRGLHVRKVVEHGLLRYARPQ